MDGNIKLSATVISCIGNDGDKDDFYFNGNFANCHNTKSIQCSFEKYSNNYIFAVSDSMGLEDDKESDISAIREIKRYHEVYRKQQFSLDGISEKIYEAVQLSSNLIYSKSIISSQSSSILTGFSSIIIDNNRAVVMNLGNNGALLFRQGEQKDIFSRNYSRKNEKLKMLGITPNSNELYNDTEKILKLAEEESKTKIKLSQTFEIEEGDIIILCSDGILNNISKSRIENVVTSGLDPSKMASVLFQEASKAGVEESITLMVIQVEGVLANSYSSKRVLFDDDDDYENEPELEKERDTGKSIVNFILGFVCVLVISGVLFMGFLIFKNSGIIMANNNPSDSTAISTDTTGTTEDSSASQSAHETQATTSPSEASQSVDSQAEDSKTGDAQAKDSQSSNSQSGDVQSSDSKSGASDQGAVNSDYEEYVVQSGDTLSSISNKYYGNPNKYDVIIKYNSLKNENDLYVGQKLKIPTVN